MREYFERVGRVAIASQPSENSCEQLIWGIVSREISQVEIKANVELSDCAISRDAAGAAASVMRKKEPP